MSSKIKSKTSILPIPSKLIERRIYLIRGRQVMLASDLAELYQVPTKRLNEAVKRNLSRFPNDFMFKLSPGESKLLRSQFATLEVGRGKHSKYASYAFTEHGVVMLSSVLNSPRAIQMNIFIIRAFIELRKMLASQEELGKRLQKIEGVIKLHDLVLSGVVADIKKFKTPAKTNLIGFRIK